MRPSARQRAFEQAPGDLLGPRQLGSWSPTLGAAHLTCEDAVGRLGTSMASRRPVGPSPQAGQQAPEDRGVHEDAGAASRPPGPAVGRHTSRPAGAPNPPAGELDPDVHPDLLLQRVTRFESSQACTCRSALRRQRQTAGLTVPVGVPGILPRAVAAPSSQETSP